MRGTLSSVQITRVDTVLSYIDNIEPFEGFDVQWYRIGIRGPVPSRSARLLHVDQEVDKYAQQSLRECPVAG